MICWAECQPKGDIPNAKDGKRKDEKMAKTKDPRRVYLKNVRLSYPHLHERQKANEDAPPKFSAAFLIDPSTKSGKENLAQIKAAVEAARKEGKVPEGVKFKADRLCYFKGDDNTDDEGNVKAGYEGMMCIKASNKDPVRLLTRKKGEVDPEKSPFYGGCYVEAMLGLYATKKGGSWGIFASLDGVRFWDDGEPFGKESVSDDEWDDDEDDDEDGFDGDDEDESGDDDLLG
ncbi:hypothetical protein DSS3P1_76 [Ruegeria phage DSS3-P1]|uniref:hypothetical protein n=1 Tax=Ruegeria phage DSS3-P1 TaxID=1555208 RepID=UPI00051A979D|nr:hypothetical protein DSS3P1_76 [Ruegeria phage DSS3-P1]YP_009997293.1 hypothetical protein JT312_gp76 [Ruegeria phage vB_RpoS-V18]YP_009997375.1 hypothetical protein JT313_gp76 [Ruegeria phage vB_RpoS-V11]YP_009997459.1 hypothetical protein JT314_gp78 [Ruegeria phage vB_RpoS-V7]AIT13311.1 hypothetical protein DSS3P1_76 [Ruegeria phage DSS3-P1]AWY08781.1 hypothetical protein vBRpoSV7_78 [Ruegeria phage vB_RpoS-V7]AWY08952.1 hypothetical protein vBRpoSV18_76 [Ruegeria phage vB_RpoS-V18]AWY0